MKAGDSEHTAIVSKVYGAYYNLLPEPELAPEIPARLRGRLRLTKNDEANRRHRHLVMVGDRVAFTRPAPDQPARIQSLLPRRNALCRAVNQRIQAFAANLDRAVILMSLTDPEPNFRFLDRVLASCHAESIEPLLLFSKRDLVQADHEALAMVALYAKLGFEVFRLNLLRDDLDADPTFRDFKSRIDEGRTVIVGRSGTGKSTLCNRLLGGAYQKTDDISSVGKGRHTTTNSSLFLLNDARAFFIDTPGVKEWGTSHIDRTTLLSSFPELRERMQLCAFSNCEHRPSDRDCAVQFAIAASLRAAEDEAANEERETALHPERLFSLLAMLG